MYSPGNEQDENDKPIDEGVSYYYDDATGYEVYRDDEDEEDETEEKSDGPCEPKV